MRRARQARVVFPFLFSEGLSLRVDERRGWGTSSLEFPFLFGGTFIEGNKCTGSPPLARGFPFLFGGTFIEGEGDR